MEGGPCRASPGQGVTDHRTQPLGSGPVLLPHPHLIPLPPTVILGPSSSLPPPAPRRKDRYYRQSLWTVFLPGHLVQFRRPNPGVLAPRPWAPIPFSNSSGHRPPLGPASSGGSLKPHSCPSLTSHRSGQERFRPQQPGTTAWAH